MSFTFSLVRLNIFFPLEQPSSKSSEKEEQERAHQTDQEGFGLDPDFVSQIATVVAAKLAKNKTEEDFEVPRPNVSQYQNYERAKPTVCTVQSANTIAPVHFDTETTQNDLNDGFEMKRLLRKVPKRFQDNAKLLLDAFDQRANEITWDSNGEIF